MTTIDAPQRARLALMPQLAGLYAIWLREVKRAVRIPVKMKNVYQWNSPSTRMSSTWSRKL